MPESNMFPGVISAVNVLEQESEILGTAAMAMAGGGAAIIGAGQGRMVRGPAGHGMAGGTEVEPPA